MYKTLEQKIEERDQLALQILELQKAKKRLSSAINIQRYRHKQKKV